MNVRLDDIHSPCALCFLKGIMYDTNSIRCQRCEYNIAIKLLKRVLKQHDHCNLCKNCRRLNDENCEYNEVLECSEAVIDKNCCVHGENLLIDWEAVCTKYGIEYIK